MISGLLSDAAFYISSDCISNRERLESSPKLPRHCQSHRNLMRSPVWLIVYRLSMSRQQRKSVVDTCRLCGRHKQLSFEHVPPEAAFNSLPRFYPNTTQLIAHELEGGPPPEITHEPRGAGAYTLCGDCNNRCSRYAIHFIEWAAALKSSLDAEPTATAVATSFLMRRSRVMKQIVAMFLSANPPKMGEVNSELRRYVWSAEAVGLPARIRVHAALTRDQSARQAGVTGYVNLEDPSANSTFSEIAFAPLVLVMTFGTLPPDRRLVDISFLAQSSYNDRQTTTLELPVVTLPSYMPGTFA